MKAWLAPVLMYIRVVLVSLVFEGQLVGKTSMRTRLPPVLCDATLPLEFFLVFRTTQVLVAMEAVSGDSYWDCWRVLVPLQWQLVLLYVED